MNAGLVKGVHSATFKVTQSFQRFHAALSELAVLSLFGFLVSSKGSSITSLQAICDRDLELIDSVTTEE